MIAVAPPVPSLLRVAVVGAGVLGLMTGWRLAQAGARVVVYETAPDRPNASTVAAGMIAPAAECAAEPALHVIAADLLAARTRWSNLADELGIALAPAGTRLVGNAGDLRRLRTLLQELGFETTASSHDPAALLAPQDALLSAGGAMAALRAALLAAGGDLRCGRVDPSDDGFAVAGEALEVDVVVLAVGAPGRTSGLAPELSSLAPVKGQLLRWPRREGEEAMLRGSDGFYLASTRTEVVAGATMEPGRDDLEPDAARLAGIRAQAEAILTELRGRPPEIGVGVRAETPDGLPLVGPSTRPGVYLATGARRNGWLLAPLVADIVASQVLGLPMAELAPLAQRLHPGRFEKET